MTEIFQSSTTAKNLAKFKVKYSLPNHVELIPANNDEVYAHRPGYYAFYAYSFPLLSLVEEFCCYYKDCPTQLAPYVYKVIKKQSEFTDLAGVEVTLRHLVHLFALSFYQGTMLNLQHCGGKCLVVKMDNKGSQQL